MTEVGRSCGGALDPVARLQALRERGADAIDRVRFRYMESLASRAADRQGRLAGLLTDRLQSLLVDYEQRFPPPAPPAAQAVVPRPRPLALLLAHIGQVAGSNPEQGIDTVPSDAAGAPRQAAGKLKSVEYFRETWLNISVNQRVSQALSQAPENAGPLNSHILVLQSLELMRGISPEYLKRFMAHSEALLWLEQADSAGHKAVQKAVQKPAVRADKDKKRKTARGGSA